MKLKFVGELDAQSRPREYYETVPARDLDEREVKAIKERDPELFKALTRERKTAGGTRPALYREVASPKPKAKEASSKRSPAKPSTAKPTASGPVAAPVVADPPAEEPAAGTEG